MSTLTWPWVTTYASVLGRMNTHAPPIDVHQGYRVVTHSHISFSRVPSEVLCRLGVSVGPESDRADA